MCYTRSLGVDSRILIKIINPDSWLNSFQLRQLSAQLTSVIGYDQFFLNPEKDQHAISFCIDDYAKYPDEYKEATGQPYNSNGPAIFSQDSNEEPYIISKPHEQFLEVHLWSRYYGETYARGDWKNIFFILMWCISNVPDCEVWYGGDSSGVCLELMTFERLKAITQFYLSSGHETYYRSWCKPNEHKYLCEFCNCHVVNSGGGGDRSFWHCDSCGSQWVVVSLHRFETTRITKYDPDGEDHDLKSSSMASFDISSQIEAETRTLFPFDGVFHKKYK